MLRRLLIQFVFKKRPNRHRIAAASRNGPFTGQVFKKTNHNHLEVNHRINARSAHPTLVIGRGTQRANLRGKPKTFQGFLQLAVEPALGRRDHLIGGNPKLGLRCLFLLGEHDSQTARATIYSNIQSEYFNRLLGRWGAPFDFLPTEPRTEWLALAALETVPKFTSSQTTPKRRCYRAENSFLQPAP